MKYRSLIKLCLVALAVLGCNTSNHITIQGTKYRIYKNLILTKEIPDSVYVMDLSNQSLSKLPPDFLNYKNLIHLNLDNNYFKIIPYQIFKLHNLKYLSLDNCELDSLSPKIEFLKDLEVLSLNSNNLNTMPEEISRLKKLRYLLIKNNKFNSKEIDHIDSLINDNCYIIYHFEFYIKPKKLR